jgi:flagellin-like protein
MPIRKMLKSREAISPILATLLLIVIAVAAIVVTYAWIMTYMGNAGQQAGVMLYKDNIYWNSTSHVTSITVGNSGTADAKIVRMYIGRSQNNLVNVTASTNIGTGRMCPAKGVVTITLTWPNDLASSWTVGDYYYFRLSTDTGQQLGPFAEQAA